MTAHFDVHYDAVQCNTAQIPHSSWRLNPMLTSFFAIEKLRSKIVPALILFIPWVFASSAARAQGLNGFLPGAHRATIAVSHTLESYDEYWMGSTKVSDATLGEIETGSVSLYVDVGLLEDLAVTANFAYVDVASNGSAPLVDRGLQDRTFLLRYRFLSLAHSQFQHSFVAGAGLRAPMAPYEPNRVVALGDETQDALFRFVYQIQADVLDGAFLASEFGYDAREDDTPDGMSLFGELGVTIGRASPSLTICRTWADGGFDIGDPGFTFPGLGAESLRVGGKLYFRVSDSFGLAVSGFATPDGRNVGQAMGTSTALVLQL